MENITGGDTETIPLKPSEKAFLIGDSFAKVSLQM